MYSFDAILLYRIMEVSLCEITTTEEINRVGDNRFGVSDTKDRGGRISF